MPKKKENTEINKEDIKQVQNALNFHCPACNTCLQLQNQIEISSKKGCRCNFNPCNFKISSSSKTINIDKKENGDVELETGEHEMRLSFNRNITPEDEKHAQEVSKIVREVMKKWYSKLFKE